MIIDPGAFHWRDAQWRGAGDAEHVLYEMHIGTVTREGTWCAAAAELAGLKELGIMMLKIMPVHDFCGAYGWGYDGVCFYFFADNAPALARKVRRGREEFLSQFPSLASRQMRRLLPDPGDPGVFKSCRLDPAERRRYCAILNLHRDLLRLRRQDAVLRRSQRECAVDGAVLDDESFLLRFFALEQIDDRLLLVNFGIDAELRPVPEPLLARPAGRQWQTLWSSEDPDYGGGGGLPEERVDGWFLPGRAAFVSTAIPR